uniref:NADH-ubiquinone oxidoreductase chain 6 n=1 Tax=Abramites hypselonotus TaxID=1396860 RepID=A0A8A9IVV4_9TELE|nr:NADH dehydrogenase subunit 6 [Abramites hypselonotus]QTS03717.1 NADH dehydrogenase subunit 6 [Abramites hypselonotus]
MSYLFSLFLLGLVVGLVAVASNPAPYFAALGLVGAAGASCGVLVGYGGSFLSLVLFLVYLGGMLVVFAYSAALAAEPFPESWGDSSVIGYVLVYLSMVGVAAFWFHGGWYEGSWGTNSNNFLMMMADASGAALLYSSGGGMLIVSGWVLLLTLFVVLELTRGLSRGALRVV